MGFVEFAASRDGAKKSVENLPSILGGGPDAYGYIWEDSDGDSITFNWVDTTSSWKQVPGLTDDNVVGPIPIGFDFPYYWYKVNQFWVGSNGYIAFQDGILVQPFDSMPFLDPPNDVLGVLIADILFGPTSTARVFYYSNDVDSLIVSFLNCPSWDPIDPNGVGSHTFQVILNKADSTITYQYGPQSGEFSNRETAIGIENVTGEIGLSYLNDMNPGSRIFHDSLSIKFTPPDSITGISESPTDTHLPKNFSLRRNIPNPFNRITTIYFAISTPNLTSLEIFDITGRHVRTLIEADKEPGNYRVEWKGISQ
jgi:hypothetical protein